ncbi:hypothetical protein Maes01_02777 [Microbulbifer aestuariivivens]|uniref:DUF262 domain-containing protein n=1 Tax=Microbulbifer aestuariivivens TaxID=1908308 RepID=A0ABP9WSK0_9GAMM
MTVIVASCTLKQLFEGQPVRASDGSLISGHLAIPEYQRPYRWNGAQIGRLLKDYQAYTEDLTEGDAKYAYYLGSVILHQAEKRDQLNIIDGQQRLTTFALIEYLKRNQEGQQFDLGMIYHSPESQIQIKQNFSWLKENALDQLKNIDPNSVSLTLVVTRSEDDAYRFFETQNTGGVRLSGPDIIKAHHLRVLSRDQQNKFASKWEEMGDLNPIVTSLIKGRYWQTFLARKVPSHRQPQSVRSAVVDELGDGTGRGADIAYGRVVRENRADGAQLLAQAQQGYELRQPLNAGVNTIHYLAYFEGLRATYLKSPNANLAEIGSKHKEIDNFYHFYQSFVCHLEGCSYLKGLYDTCLLLYISQFGEKDLFLAAKKLFHVVYSPRVSNQKAVREASISAFIRETPVLDWIAVSYTSKTLFEYLDNFTLEVDPANLGPEHSGVKKKFVLTVLEYFGKTVPKNTEAQDLADVFLDTMNRRIVQNLSSGGRVNVI